MFSRIYCHTFFNTNFYFPQSFFKIFFNDFFHEFFSVWVVFWLVQSSFSQFAIWKKKNNKYLLKKLSIRDWWNHLMNLICMYLIMTHVCGSCHLGRASNVEIGVEYWMIFFNMLWNIFWGTFKVYKRLGDFSMKIAEHFVLLFDQAVNEKVNTHSKIGCQFQNSMPSPNEMIHLTMSRHVDKICRWFYIF